jgi:hypothetical protein
MLLLVQIAVFYIVFSIVFIEDQMCPLKFLLWFSRSICVELLYIILQYTTECTPDLVLWDTVLILSNL